MKEKQEKQEKEKAPSGALTMRLTLVDRTLTVRGLEFEFAAHYLDQVRQQAAISSGKTAVEFTGKQIRRYTTYAIQALQLLAA